MSSNYLTDQINILANEWENFKQQNDFKLKQLERKNAADPITIEQLEKINQRIDNVQNIIKNQEIQQERPLLSSHDSKHETKFTGHDVEHKKAFNNYLRKGIDNNLPGLESKALNTMNDHEGGYFVTRHIEHNVISQLNEISVMRKLADRQKISTDALEILEDYNHAESGWSNETSPIRETSVPKISKKIIPVHELFAQPKATQKLIDDAAINIDQWLEDKIITSFAHLEEQSFIKGDGISKPKGILSYQDGKEWGKVEQIKTGVNGTITVNSLLKLIYALPDIYRNKANLIMNRQTTFAIRSLKNDQTGHYIWNPGLYQGGNDTIFGLPVHHCDHMPLIANGELAIAAADFKQAYLIIDRCNIKLMRDPFTEKPFVKFYITKRVGGDIKNFEAIKLLKLA